jgi:hypothetical protein
MKMRIVLAIAAAMFLAPRAALAQAGDLWEVTVKMEMPGMPMAMPAQTHRLCLAKQPNDESYIPRNPDCKVTETRRTGNTQRFKMVCTGRHPMNMEGEVTHAKDAYSGRSRMTGKMEGQDMDMTQIFSGKKVGDCTNPVK